MSLDTRPLPLTATEAASLPAPVPPRGTARRARRLSPAGATVLWVSVVVAAISAWLVVYGLGLSGVQESRAQTLAYAELRQDLAEATAPLGGAIAAAAPVALLSIPDAGITDAVVVEGTSGQVLEQGPGHRRDTVLPGQAGTSVVMGRGVLFGGPFASLPQVPVGSTIAVITGQGEFRYRVEGVRRAGDPLPAPVAQGAGRLVLVTSEGEGWRSGWAPSSAVMVDAVLEGDPAPTPGGRPAAVPAGERAMGTDPSALLPMLLWAQLLLLTSLALVWAWFRWGRWQTWLAGAPVLLAVLWGLTESAAPLLPNLL